MEAEEWSEGEDSETDGWAVIPDEVDTFCLTICRLTDDESEEKLRE